MIKVWMTGLNEIRMANCATKRKVPNLSKLLPLPTWRKWLRQGHSTLRFASVYVFDDDCPYTVACQIIRGTKEHTQGVMSSGRPDITGKTRDYTQSRWLFEKYTPKGFLEMMHDRLCTRAEAPTRYWATRVVNNILEDSDNPYLLALAEMAGPFCKTVNNCPEGKYCFGEWERV